MIRFKYLSNVVDSETAIGDTWTTCVTPYNGSQSGIEVCSNALTILSLPTVIDVRPILGSQFEYLDSIEIAANVSADPAISIDSEYCSEHQMTK